MERSVGAGRVPSLKDTGVANSSLERLAVKWARMKGGGRKIIASVIINGLLLHRDHLGTALAAWLVPSKVACLAV